jgi:carboxyl-terminal processing protease
MWAVQQVEERYVEEVEPADLLEGAYNGILSQLDEYSGYIPPERIDEFREDTQGEFGGLGIEITFDAIKKLLKVERPIPGTPAFDAGVMAGDIIIKVHDHVTGETYETHKFQSVHDAVRVLRGKEGTRVTITVVHMATAKQEELTIEREKIKIPGVRTAGMVDSEWKIGHVYVPTFHERTVDDLQKAIKNLNKQGMRGMVLDLRFNPGGLLPSAVNMADMFLNRGIVVSTRGRSEPEQVFKTHSEDILMGGPMVVLVNRYSASASEIVAGALKDHKRAIVVGETTYGKGSVQTILPLPGGEGAFKLTTAKYYTPSGVCIEDEGVKPHVEIKISAEETIELARYLSELSRRPEDGENGGDADGNDETDGANGDNSEGEQFTDVQLERAVDMLKALLIEQDRRKASPAKAA